MHSKLSTLVVIELGGIWPRWLAPSTPGLGNVGVVAQHYAGAPGDLLTQVASRVARLEQAGWRLERVVFVSNGKSDRTARAHRAVLVRGLLSRLLTRRVGTLILTSDAHASERHQRELSGLVEALAPEALGARVKVRFEPPSGRRGGAWLVAGEPAARVDAA